MKPCFLFPVTIDSTNNKLYVKKTGDPSTTTLTITSGTYFHIFDNDETSSLPAQLQDLLFDNAFHIRVRIESGKYVFRYDPNTTTFQLNAGANSIYTEIGVTSSQLDATMAATLTAQYQHSNGWLADNSACLHYDGVRGNNKQPIAHQTTSWAGEVVTRYYNILEYKVLTLKWLSKEKTFGYGATAYGDFTTLNRNIAVNESFELFFRKAVQGTRFRFYRDYEPAPLARHTTTLLTSSSITVSAPTIDGDSKYYGYTAEVQGSTTSQDDGECVIITSNSDTTITFSGSWVQTPGAATPPIVIKDLRYDTYVLDKGIGFNPVRMFPDIDNLFSINLTLRKYIA